MAIQRLSHVGICVSDIDRSMNFYGDVFGFKEVTRMDVSGDEAENLLEISDLDLQAIILQRDGTCIELLHYRSPGHVDNAELRKMNLLGLTHLSFMVTDIQSVIESVKEAGGAYLEQTAFHVKATKMKGTFVTDPDGMKIELLEMITS